ncbi:WGR domain-containing protein [Rhizobium sp. 9140]|uniref:WGR domain-containing protein n=1 Tax=Rhizobium sp. 9140 TaxID=1761900 RepID=UPI00079A720F|nr:WGR domain-containing protein [Rhizobium sp. 9140]CZT37169.1 WGR domain-containing protein, predicted DNA-binding domain in MolR [Rhizobium sp. 9140]
MKTPSYRLHLERCGPSRGMARFYAPSLEPSLFCEIVLVCRCCRIGSAGRSRTEVFADDRAAMMALHWQKRARGYAVGQCGLRRAAARVDSCQLRPIRDSPPFKS